jgi:hypothetical protein
MTQQQLWMFPTFVMSRGYRIIESHKEKAGHVFIIEL